MSMIKLLLTNFVHHTSLVDVVYPLNFRHQRLTILGLNQFDITYAEMKVWSGKNIVTFDLFEHRQTNKQATNYIDVVDGIKVSSFYIMANRQLSSGNSTIRSDSEKSLIGFENNIHSMCKRISIYRLNSNNMATVPKHLSITFIHLNRVCCNESYLMDFVFQLQVCNVKKITLSTMPNQGDKFSLEVLLLHENHWKSF